MKITVDSAEGLQEFSVKAGQKILDVLQANHIDIRANCGGVGKCGRCQVLVRDDEGLNWKLACMTEVADGMEVVVERQEAMTVLEDGIALDFPPDEGATGYGMAIDIGTTTVVAHLHNLETGIRIATASCSNPQIAFGADVISRITASMEGKLDLMCNCIQNTLRELKRRLCETAGINDEEIIKVTIAGNTVMQHIAVGLSPDTIGVNPFTPLSLFGDYHTIEGLGSCYLAPCVASYVGGDITAGMLACNLDNGQTRLFLDLGTNGEMALAKEGRIVSCATAAGPVFEGSNVYFGMPAAPGAISQVRYEEGKIVIKTIDDKVPVGICGTGIIDAIATAVTLGIIDDTGYLLGADEVDDPVLACWLGEENDRNVFYLTEDHSLYITQNDVRSMQLAKAAVCAGIYTMMAAWDVKLEDIEKMEIAGGFGKFLNLQSAAAIGLFPPELLDRAASVGNTSASGASAALISTEALRHLETIDDTCTYLELSVSKEFNEFYVETMTFD